jgi:hypothetical protein
LYRSRKNSGISDLEQGVYNWSKYNALNIGTITGTGEVPKYGTIEFRHLYGTGDKVTIINWLNNILKLRRASVNVKLVDLMQKVLTLNTTSEYVALYQEVFGEYADTNKMIKYDYENCVTYVKEWEWGDLVNDDMKLNQGSRLHKHLIRISNAAGDLDTLFKMKVGF